MGYPSCKEQWDRRRGEVGRIGQKPVVIDVVTRVVEQHYHHHNAAKQIDREYPPFQCQVVGRHRVNNASKADPVSLEFMKFYEISAFFGTLSLAICLSSRRPKSQPAPFFCPGGLDIPITRRGVGGERIKHFLRRGRNPLDG